MEIKYSGLNSSEAERLYKRYGPNEIEKRFNFSKINLFIQQFKSSLIYILLVAGFVSLLLGNLSDGIVILLAVLTNVTLGFFQEYKAEKSLLSLYKILVPHIKVIRNGKEQTLQRTMLVPGDIAILSTGHKVPADGVLIEAVDLEINEAVLTGESFPISKISQNDVFMGTTIAAGRGLMKVIKTGSQTKMGGIAKGLSGTVEEETPLKKQVSQTATTLTKIFAVLCVLVFIIGFWQGRNFLEIFTLSVALAVAAIPEGLMITLTVILTLGMQRILKKKGLVRKLMAAETLATVDVICADKTGTLTQGTMKVLETKSSGPDQELREAAILCNNLINPVEKPMMEWAKSAFKDSESLIKNNPRIDEIPFSSERKYIAILTQKTLYISGAPEKILGYCSFSQKEKEKWLKQFDYYAKQGLRIVSFAWRKRELQEKKIKEENFSKKLINYGLIVFEDPLRHEVKDVFFKAQKAGIDIKVMTGDYLQTAKAIVDKLALIDHKLKEEEMMSGEELKQTSEGELAKKLEKIILFYRMSPEQKIKIVKALQLQGHSVAMMGDGVNDALALERANIGIVMGEASQVAKETADIVLLDSNFKTIIAAIDEGRGIFLNIKKIVFYLLSYSYIEIILIGSSFLLGLAAPILSVQLLWINLVEDGFIGLSMAFDPKERNLMTRKPFSIKDSIFDKEMKFTIFFIGIVTSLLLIAVFSLLLKLNYRIEVVRTIIFVSLVLNSLIRVFSCKSLKKSIWKINFFDNPALILSVIIGFFILLASIYLPFLSKTLQTEKLALNLWILSLILALAGVWAQETAKIVQGPQKWSKEVKTVNSEARTIRTEEIIAK